MSRQDVMWPDTHYFRMAWSLAQHYLVGTALTDVTFDLRVASWFATNEWDPSKPGPKDGEIGVIYRIQRPQLEQVLAAGSLVGLYFAAEQNLTPPPDLFLVDIREIPSEFARRPRVQHGASIYGFDQPHVVSFAMQKGAIEAFEFIHRSRVDIGIGREDVVPPEDPFLEPLQRFIGVQRCLSPNRAQMSDPDSPALDCLNRANTVLKLGVESARHAPTHELTGEVIAYVFDEVERMGRIRFSHLMVVEHKPSKAIECAISAEPMDLFPELKALPPGTLARLGFGSDTLRHWSLSGSPTVALGQFTSIDKFTARALELVRQAGSPHESASDDP